MNKDEHILRILTKIKHKKYEHFVISRIIHKIINSDIKFVCQQLVRRPDNRGRALLDMYFPQVNLSLEVDEPQHAKEAHANSDKQRSRDIISSVGLTEKRISTFETDQSLKSLTAIAKDTDEFLEYLRVKVSEARRQDNWAPWDFDNELTARPHLARGYIDARENVLLRKHTDVIELFGKKLRGHQSGGWLPPEKFNLTMVWFPRLYQNDKWNNSLSDDGKVIVEKNEDERGLSILDQSRYGPNHRRAVFARKEEPLIGTLYRFVGVFEYSSKECARKNGGVLDAVYNKVEDIIRLE